MVKWKNLAALFGFIFASYTLPACTPPGAEHLTEDQKSTLEEQIEDLEWKMPLTSDFASYAMPLPDRYGEVDEEVVANLDFVELLNELSGGLHEYLDEDRIYTITREELLEQVEMGRYSTLHKMASAYVPNVNGPIKEIVLVLDENEFGEFEFPKTAANSSAHEYVHLEGFGNHSPSLKDYFKSIVDETNEGINISNHMKIIIEEKDTPYVVGYFLDLSEGILSLPLIDEDTFCNVKRMYVDLTFDEWVDWRTDIFYLEDRDLPEDHPLVLLGITENEFSSSLHANEMLFYDLQESCIFALDESDYDCE
mgnify:CR=1 FL=1|jgi:hypothetical protein